VRELAADRPELPARSAYEVERARVFVLRGTELSCERPSLFDDALADDTQHPGASADTRVETRERRP
jgi:hypothetical protein